MAPKLSPEQVREYQDQGFLIIDEPLFPGEKFAAFKERFEMHLAVWEEVMGAPVDAIDRAHFVDPRLNDWLLADEVLDLVEPLIGPDIALFASSCLKQALQRRPEDSLSRGRRLLEAPGGESHRSGHGVAGDRSVEYGQRLHARHPRLAPPARPRARRSERHR